MGILDEVTSMKNQGMSDQDIVTSLQQRGISPKEINDALSQSQIKSAISPQVPVPENPPQMSQTPYVPQTMEGGGAYPAQEMYAPQEQQFYQEGYGGYPAETTSTDNIIEVAQQVFEQKTKKMQKQLQELIEFKTLAQTHIQSISQRLKRIESTIDALQIQIIKKIGTYGQNLESIKKEMNMMQDSFSKVVNQAVQGATPKKPTTRKTTRKKTSKKK